jgi:hypothetical protein
MKKIFYSFLLFIVSCTGNKTEPSLPQQLSQGRWIDLTHSFSEETLYWPTAEKFRFDTVFVGEAPAGFYY